MHRKSGEKKREDEKESERLMGNQATSIFFPPVLQKEPQIQLPIIRNLRHSDDVTTWGCATAPGGELQKK